MLYKLGTNHQVVWWVLMVTSVSVVVSFVTTYLAMALAYGHEPNAIITVARAKEFGLITSILIPLFTCPPLCLKISRIVQQRDLAHLELQQVAQTDPLSGLLNRRGFDGCAQNVVAECERNNIPVAAMMIDIDHFKMVNDGLGHDFGDAAIKQIAYVLRDEAQRRGYVVGRQGGEEFVVVAPGSTPAQALEVAEQLRLACSQTPVRFNGQTKTITISIGVTSQNRSPMSLSRLIGEADTAMYHAKRTGRDRVVLFQSLDAPAAAA